MKALVHFAAVVMMVYGVRIIALGVHADNETVGFVFGGLFFLIGYLLGKLADKEGVL